MSEQEALFDLPPEPAPAAKPARRSAAPAAVVKNTVRILLEESDDIPPGGLFLGHNGRTYMLRPGVEADIPLFLKEILDHSVITVPEIDPMTRQVRGWRNRLKYNYRVIN